MHEVIIIGAGPAGLTSGLYLGRARVDTLILERLAIGGQVLLTEKIENFPGFPDGVLSQKLIDDLARQVKQLGVKIQTAEVLNISSQDKSFSLKLDNGCELLELTSKAIIVATGANPKNLNMPGEKEFTGRGVSYCGTCDAPLFKEKIVAVIGGGDKALEEALYLSRFAKKIFLIHRRDEFRATKILQEEVSKERKIEVVFNTIPLEIVGKQRVEALKIQDVKSKEANLLSCDGVFIFIGIIPNTNFLNKILSIDKDGFIIADEAMQSSRAGVFACGDCRRHPLYQIITACGEGATAAFSCYHYLENLKK